MIHIEQAIIVEGKYDKIKLSSILDAVIIVTNGFGIFKDKEKAAIIKHFAAKTGIIIATDSDAAGFTIRNHLKGIITDGKIFHVYMPDIIGKEKRKIQPSKEGKLGVEGIDKDIIIRCFESAGIIFNDKPKNSKQITKLDFYEDGLSGRENSSVLRKILLKQLNLPQLITCNSMLEIINSMLTFDEYKDTISNIKKENGGF